MRNSPRGYTIVLCILLGIFITSNFFVYRSNAEVRKAEPLSRAAEQGQDLYQRHNCTACHQFYGLGGYLGPDLTNVWSAPNKGPDYIKAMLNSGVKSMPVFQFSDAEKEQLVAYLEAIDRTGTYPNREAKINLLGWVKLKYKDGRK